MSTIIERKGKVASYIKLLRVKHYIKNVLILIPVFLTNSLLDVNMLTLNLLGLVAFSFCASIVYIFNDLIDVEADRNHPLKSKRPIASGEINGNEAYIMVVCLIIAIILLALISGKVISFLLIPIVYVFINIGYSMGLKRIPLVDVFILMLGYLLRIEYGGMLTECGVSAWVFLTAMSVAFFMGFGKRLGEMRKYGAGNRESLKAYTEEFLDKGMSISCTLAIVFYSLTCADSNTVIAKNNISLLWSVPLMIIIVFRYLMIIQHGENDGDPVSVILSDKILIILLLLYIISVFCVLYVFPMGIQQFI